MAALRCAFDVWKYVHWSNAHRINQPPNLQRSVCGGCRPPIALAQISTPFPTLSSPHGFHPLPDLFRLRIPSDLFSRAAPGLFFTFHRRRRRLRVSAPISLDRGFFAILFAPSLSHPRGKPDGGGDGDGRSEGAAVGIRTQPRQFSYRTT